MLAAFFSLPVIASYLAFYVWRPEDRVNYGELLEPRPLPDIGLRSIDGAAFRLSQLGGAWVLLQVDSGCCDSDCQMKLYTMRQLRLTQGKNRDRIERVWLIVDENPPAAELLVEYPGVWLVKAQGSALLTEFPARRDAADHIYLIDPYGNLMMRYPKDPDTRRMVKDLTRLLRISGSA
jgi:hypothetical protein